MVGLATAQSIDESSTCLELSTFHSTMEIEVSRVLGIEAARQLILEELQGMLSYDGSKVGYKHLAILVTR